MLTYNMDVTPESLWKRTTPSEAELTQPYYCTEAGVFYAQQHFSTARTDKESYLLFYTLRGAGLIEQGESHVVLSTGQALLLNCRTPQSYCTAPGQSCWHHYWVHLDGAGVAAMEPLLLPGKKLTPVQLTGGKMQELFETILGQMERSTVDSMVTMGLALHEMLALCAQSILAQAEATSTRQVILQAAETLRKNYQKELCLADLLAEAHMSKSYFLRLFRRYMGTTPYNYLVNFRITQAAEKSSDMSARGAPNFERQIVRFDVLFCCATPKNRGLHGQCTVFARLAFSWESSAWAGIALKCVVNFASGQQSQTELSLHFGVCILQKFQQSGHRDGRFAFGGYSLLAGVFLFGVEPFLKLLTQLYTRGLLDMGVGVYQHICRSVSCGSLNSLHIAAGDHQLIGGTGMLDLLFFGSLPPLLWENFPICRSSCRVHLRRCSGRCM